MHTVHGTFLLAALMKTHSLHLLIITLLLSGCATDNAAIKPVVAAKKPAMQHSAKKHGICADAKAPPLSQCSETVTATFDSKGTLWIVWVNNDWLYVQSSADKGRSYSAPVRVNATPEAVAAQNESRPKIKVDAQGHIYLSWVQTLDKKRSTYVRFSRSTDGGQHFSTPVTVNDNLEIIRHRFDSLALGQHGEILVAWLDARHTEAAKKTQQEFDGLSLYYAWSDDGGQHFYPNKKIADHTCECCRLDTAINQHNLPVIAWRHIFEGGIRDHAVVTFTDWNTPSDINPLGQENWKIDACPHHGPGLAIAATGVYHAVWFSNAETKQGLFYGYSTDAGESFSAPINFAGAGASHPHVLALGARVGVVWQAFDGKKNSVQFMQSTDAGKTWAKPVTVAQSTEMLDEPFLVSDGQQLYLSWHALQQEYQLTLL
ncbi:MAG: sialidase family protein [Methylococcales bacterium]|nr:sialidase family protein [Methylococcales bacterium]